MILLIARIFPRPCGARKNTTQLAKCPRVLYDKPSNERFIIPLQKGVILIQFYLLRVFFKKCIICPSGRLRTMQTVQKASQINSCPLFDCINEMTRDKRWQAKFSGFGSRWKQFFSLKNCRSVRSLLCSKPVKPGHYSVLTSDILRVLLTKYGKVTS